MAALNDRELRGLTALCDALLPADRSPWRASLPSRAAAVLAAHPDPAVAAQARRFLGLLELPPAALMLGGRWSRLSALDAADAQRFLARLQRHRSATVRGAFHALKRLVAVTYYGDADESGRNPTWSGLGYPGPIAPGRPIGPRLRTTAIDRESTLDCDVVVVGSGAGGAVVAAELAAAGRDVLVLERGGHFEEGDFDQREVASLRRLYLDGALGASADQGVVVLAGSCLGGGTVVNYTTSFRTPDAVRQEWAELSGLDLFSGPELSRSLDAVSARLAVNEDHDRPSARDAIMARGLTSLGWHVGRLPRNVVGCTQDDVCGYCGFGCVRGAKRSMLRTYLQDAVAAGARIVTDCDVERVSLRGGAATGVEARLRAGALVTVRAKAVVVAAGAINTPALLLRSGIGGPVGDGLRLHPITAVWGRFAEEVRPWTGTMQALYSDQLADLDAGYGTKFETGAVHPAFMALATPWHDAAHFDEQVRALAHTSLIAVFLRDRYGGRVTVSRAGRPVVRYAVSRYDQAHVRRGIEGAARVLVAAGATRLHAMQSRYEALDVASGEALPEWLSRADRIGYGANETLYATFHQMGTCRMGASRRAAVVDGTGQTYAARGLYVADGSLFPSASGVNPMISIAGLAHYVAQQLKAALPA